MQRFYYKQYLIYLSLAWLLSACAGQPAGVQVVSNVDVNQYLGTWYEIARLDHSFERGLERVTATYQLREDGGISVVNRGFNVAKNTWEEATGKAYFIEAANADKTYIGKLKVSFFGPFYGAYNIIKLDQKYYNYVMICGPDLSYFWILARTPQLAYPIKQELISQAKALGFDTDNLIHVKQSDPVIQYKAGPHIP